MPVKFLNRRIPGLSWCLRLPQRYGRANTTLLGILTVVFAAGLIFLTEAEKPWGKAVQKRLAKGQELQLAELVITGVWWGALAAGVILLLLLATHRWWLPARGQTATDTTRHPWRQQQPRWLVGLLGGLALAMCLWQGVPRLSQSLWNDEEYAMRRFAHGEWEKQEDGTMIFEPVTWRETLFSNRLINNHLLNSLTMRCSLGVWREVTGQPRHAFSETAARMPSLLAGLGSIVIVVWIGVLMGAPLTGAAAALLLALTPWHVHYATDAKGYSELLFFILLHIAGLLKALQTNRLRWWLLFGFAEAGYLLCFPASIYLAVVTNAMVLLELLLTRRMAMIRTLVAVNLIGAIPVILWAAPSIPQAIAYLSQPDTMRLGMNAAWMRDLLCSLYLGFGYANPMTEHHFGTSWIQFRDSAPWWLHHGFALGLIPVLCLTGFVSAAVKNRATRLAILAPLLAAILSLAHNSAKNSPMVVWHFMFILPALALLVCLGISTLCRNHRVLNPLLLLLVTGVYAYSVHDASTRKRNHDRQPIRQTAEWINRQAPDALTATWGVSDLQSQSYLPKVHALKSLDELHALELLAETKKQPLYIYFCGETVTSQRDPELTQHVRQSGDYKMVHELKGLEELFSYRIYHWQPKPAELPATQPPATAPELPQSEVPAAAGS